MWVISEGPGGDASRAGEWETGATTAPPRRRRAPRQPVSTTFQATVAWEAPVSFVDALVSAKTGLYVIERDGRPLYVGMAMQQPIGRRMCQHLWYKKMGATLRLHRAKYSVRIGAVLVGGRPAADVRTVYGAEAALIRSLVKAGYRLANVTWNSDDKLPLPPGAALRVDARGAAPSYVRWPIELSHARQGAEYEWAGPPRGEPSLA